MNNFNLIVKRIWIQSVSNRLTLLRSHFSSVMKMEAAFSSKPPVFKRPTRRHIPEDGILRSHRRENIKSYRI
jgi:hypothetical protein